MEAGGVRARTTQALGLVSINRGHRARAKARAKPACLTPYPFSGCTVMARGLSRPWEMTT